MTAIAVNDLVIDSVSMGVRGVTVRVFESARPKPADHLERCQALN